MASTLLAMASTLKAMASNLKQKAILFTVQLVKLLHQGVRWLDFNIDL